MRLWEQRLSSFVRSKAMSILLAVAAIAMTLCAGPSPCGSDVFAAGQFMLPSPQSWFTSPVEALWVNLCVIILVAAMMFYINRRFNILRSQSVIYSGLFMFMTAATPQIATQFTGSSLLAAAIFGAIILYFSDYNNPARTRPLFLAAFFIGVIGLFCVSAYFYIPVLIIGLVQMRVFSVRSLAAVVIGLLTPVWIIWGLGISEFGYEAAPFFVPVSELVSTQCGIGLIAAVSVTLLAGLTLGSAVLIKILSFNVRIRSLNGLLSVISIASGLLVLVNYSNMQFYVTVLNATVAFQVAHFMRINRKRSGYIAALILISIYTGLYVWSQSV